MKLRFVLLGLAGLLGVLVSAARAQGEWFTVTGNPSDSSVNTVQVDPVALATDGATKTMNVRVNRSEQRLNWEKMPYRSYESQVVFDCQNRRAGYVQARFFLQPLWQGEPSVVSDYTDSPRPMLFRDMEPNPTNRIVRAACRLRG